MSLNLRNLRREDNNNIPNGLNQENIGKII
jgi:hypothetical protein